MVESLARIPESDRPMTEPNIHIDAWIPESHYHGLHALINWLDGFEKAKSGVIPGHFELVMHFRMLSSAIREKTAKKDGPLA